MPRRTTTVSFRITRDEKQALELIATEKNITLSELLQRIVRGYLRYKGYIA